MNFVNNLNDPKLNNNINYLAAPIAALKPSTSQCLSTMLNPLKVIPNDKGLPRDWRGVAELAGISIEMITYLESKPDPTGELIKKLTFTNDQPFCNTLGDLKAIFAVLDRYDIVDDVGQMIESDGEAHLLKMSSMASDCNANREIAPIDISLDSQILTLGDTERILQGKSPSRYDAFILYSDDDSEFANEIVKKMESDYNLKMCMKDRDLLPGVMFEHEIIGRIIEERCNRLLVIFSPSFLETQANKFLVSYAQALALELRVRKIIPCMYKKCDLPPSVRYAFCLNYLRAGKLWNFWDRLADSLRTTTSPRAIEPEVSIGLSTSLPSTSDVGEAVNFLSLKPLEDAVSWWDAEKSRPRSSLSLSDVQVAPEEKEKEKPKGRPKWLKKVMRPLKKEKRKEPILDC